MRRIATLLLIYLSLVSASPLLKPILSCNGSSCASQTTQEKQDPSKTTCPFAACCCNICTVCYLQEEKIEFEPVFTGTEKLEKENKISTSSYINECWHPPEMV
jgi:hypothetical protein